VANDAGLVFQPTFFSLFCCKLKKPAGVTEGSPCALASTAPDTVFEALEEAATLFAQQRQKVVVWWFVSVW
jgi:CO dehydrogenase/acetyl-CoA synthase delta subunit